MKKIVPLIVVGILVLSGLGAVALPSDQPETIEKTVSISFLAQPVIQSKGEFVEVTFEGANSWSLEEGNPVLPIRIETLILPKTAKNIKVECTPKAISTMEISGEIIPAKTYHRGIETEDDVKLEKNELTYKSSELYPKKWYTYDVGRGLDGREQVTFVKVVCYAVRCSPANNKLEYLSGLDIKVTYRNQENHPRTTGEYDLVIIGPAKFEQEYQKLIDHKNDVGVSTMYKTVEDILDEYEGFDAPEEIKLFIKDANETLGAGYFLLGAGLKSHINADDKDDRNQGTTDWLVPVRYTNIPEDDGHGVISDLYYADLYDDEGNFSSWDSNEDGIYAAWGVPFVQNDDLDLHPDVFVSRIPCRNKFQVRRITNKIINYESTGPDDKPWFKTMIGIGGKTFQIYQGQPDGEYVCDTSIDYMGDLVDNPIRVYASNRDTGGYTPTPEDIPKAWRQGAGYIDMQGHGNPLAWNTHWEDSDEWCGNTNIYDFWKLFNFKELPVVVIGGCHNALFNVTFMKTRDDSLPRDWYWTYGTACPACFSYALLLVPWGGAIASTGCTGYGIGYSGQPLSLSAGMESDFFHQIGQADAQTPAEAHAGAITKYINEHEIVQVDAFCITEFQLFADPSMVLGGYE